MMDRYFSFYLERSVDYGYWIHVPGSGTGPVIMDDFGTLVPREYAYGSYYIDYD